MPTTNDVWFINARRRMVDEQLRRRGVQDPRVLAAMDEVPRERFVRDVDQVVAYADGALPIAMGQTISQPYTVAYMLEALRLTGVETVLDVGTGSGYAAAVLSRLARVVHSVERIPALYESARARLAELGYDNVHCHLADGSLGLPSHAPFDAIVVAAGAKRLPASYLEQLARGGRLVIPLGGSRSQRLCRFTKVDGQARREDLGPFVFVPLVSGGPEDGDFA